MKRNGIAGAALTAAIATAAGSAAAQPAPTPAASSAPTGDAAAGSPFPPSPSTLHCTPAAGCCLAATVPALADGRTTVQAARRQLTARGLSARFVPSTAAGAARATPGRIFASVPAAGALQCAETPVVLYVAARPTECLGLPPPPPPPPTPSPPRAPDARPAPAGPPVSAPPATPAPGATLTQDCVSTPPPPPPPQPPPPPTATGPDLRSPDGEATGPGSLAGAAAGGALVGALAWRARAGRGGSQPSGPASPPVLPAAGGPGGAPRWRVRPQAYDPDPGDPAWNGTDPAPDDGAATGTSP